MSATGHPLSASGPFAGVVLGASGGGIVALRSVLAGLPPTFPTPILVVQHGRRRPVGEQRLARVLARSTALAVHTACHGQPLDRPGASVVPTGFTATAANGRLSLLDEPTTRPSDALLTSLAPVLGRTMIAAILTGHLNDGAAGARAVKRHGGRVLAQDPATAEAPSMPTSALATGCVDFALPLDRIPAALIALTLAPGGAEMLAVPTPPWARLLA